MFRGLVRPVRPPVPIDFVDVTIVACRNEPHGNQSGILALAAIAGWLGKAAVIL
jgi:hypothetical protein